MRFVAVSYTDVLAQLQGSGVAHAISKSNHLIGATLQVAHIFGFILLLSSLTVVSLRLLGLAFTKQPVVQVARDGNRLIWIGLALAVVSGTLMFISGARHYGENWAFEMKMGLLLAAVIAQVALFRRVATTDFPSPALARTSAVVSLGLWFGVGLAGRMIGFI
jgi:hypothetical protein